MWLFQWLIKLNSSIYILILSHLHLQKHISNIPLSLTFLHLILLLRDLMLWIKFKTLHHLCLLVLNINVFYPCYQFASCIWNESIHSVLLESVASNAFHILNSCSLYLHSDSFQGLSNFPNVALLSKYSRFYTIYSEPFICLPILWGEVL